MGEVKELKRWGLHSSFELIKQTPNIPIITLNVNDLNISIKRQRLAE